MNLGVSPNLDMDMEYLRLEGLRTVRNPWKVIAQQSHGCESPFFEKIDVQLPS